MAVGRIHASRLGVDRPLVCYLLSHSSDARATSNSRAGRTTSHPILRFMRWQTGQCPSAYTHSTRSPCSAPRYAHRDRLQHAHYQLAIRSYPRCPILPDHLHRHLASRYRRFLHLRLALARLRVARRQLPEPFVSGYTAHGVSEEEGRDERRAEDVCELRGSLGR